MLIPEVLVVMIVVCSSVQLFTLLSSREIKSHPILSRGFQGNVAKATDDNFGIVYATFSRNFAYREVLRGSKQLDSFGMKYHIFTDSTGSNFFRTQLSLLPSLSKSREKTLVSVVPDSFFMAKNLSRAGRTFRGDREGKIYAFIHSPYKYTLFLDEDTLFCGDPKSWLGYVHDLVNSKSIAATCKDQFSCNSGVVFWKASTFTEALWTLWLEEYRKGLLEKAFEPCTLIRGCEHCSDCTPGNERILVQDQGPLRNALKHLAAQGLEVASLNYTYNCKQDLIPSQDNSDRLCCATLAGGEACLIEHKCKDRSRKIFWANHTSNLQ